MSGVFTVDRNALLAPFVDCLTEADAYKILWGGDETLTEDENGDVTGNDQRRSLQAVGRDRVSPFLSSCEKPVNIADFRSGACITTFHHLLKDVRVPAVFHLVEAAAHRRVEYADQLASQPQGAMGTVVQSHLAELAGGQGWLKRFFKADAILQDTHMDLALMLHSLHAVPEDKIVPVVQYAYKTLKPGGRLAILVPRHDTSVMGYVTQAVLGQMSPINAAAYKARNTLFIDLFVNGGIVDCLDGASGVYDLYMPTRSFRPTPEGLVKSAISNDILYPTDRPFSKRGLMIAAEAMEQFAKEWGIECLSTNEHDNGWWAAPQPQHWIEIEKG